MQFGVPIARVKVVQVRPAKNGSCRSKTCLTGQRNRRLSVKFFFFFWALRIVLWCASEQAFTWNLYNRIAHHHIRGLAGLTQTYASCTALPKRFSSLPSGINHGSRAASCSVFDQYQAVQLNRSLETRSIFAPF